VASIKALEFEKKLLATTGELKQLVHESFAEDPDAKIRFLIKVNNLFEVAHSESRRLRKACAFLHDQVSSLSAQVRELGGFPNITDIGEFSNKIKFTKD